MKRGDIVTYVDPRGKVHHCLIRAWGGNPDRNLSLLELTEKSQPVEYSVGYERVTAAGETYRGEVLLTIETAVEVGERILAWLKSDAGKAWLEPTKRVERDAMTGEIPDEKLQARLLEDGRGDLEPYQIPTHLANKLGKMSREHENYLAFWCGRYTQALRRVGGWDDTRLAIWIALNHEGFTKSQIARGEAFARYYGPDHQEIRIQIPAMQYKAVDSHERKAKARIQQFMGEQDRLALEGMTPLQVKQTKRQDVRPVHLVTDVEAENARPGCYSCGVAFTTQNRSTLPDVCKDCLRHDLMGGFGE